MCMCMGTSCACMHAHSVMGCSMQVRVRVQDISAATTRSAERVHCPQGPDQAPLPSGRTSLRVALICAARTTTASGRPASRATLVPYDLGHAPLVRRYRNVTCSPPAACAPQASACGADEGVGGAFSALGVEGAVEQSTSQVRGAHGTQCSSAVPYRHHTQGGALSL